MMKLARTRITRTDRTGTFVSYIPRYEFSCIQLFHQLNFLKQINPGLWIFIRLFLNKVDYYLKTIKYKILLIAPKKIFVKEFWD